MRYLSLYIAVVLLGSSVTPLATAQEPQVGSEGLGPAPTLQVDPNSTLQNQQGTDFSPSQHLPQNYMRQLQTDKMLLLKNNLLNRPDEYRSFCNLCGCCQERNMSWSKAAQSDIPNNFVAVNPKTGNIVHFNEKWSGQRTLLLMPREELRKRIK